MSIANIITFHRNKHDPMTTDYEAAIELAEAVERECIEAFPPLSPIELERQSIENKRVKITDEIANDDTAIAYHEAEAKRLKELRAERATVLKSLNEHDDRVSGGQPKPVKAGKRSAKTDLVAAE